MIFGKIGLLGLAWTFFFDGVGDLCGWWSRRTLAHFSKNDPVNPLQATNYGAFVRVLFWHLFGTLGKIASHFAHFQHLFILVRKYVDIVLMMGDDLSVDAFSGNGGSGLPRLEMNTQVELLAGDVTGTLFKSDSCYSRIAGTADSTI